MRACAQSISINKSRGRCPKKCEPAALVANALRLCTMFGTNCPRSVRRWRNIANATAWNVPTVGPIAPRAPIPNPASRLRISPAASRVNVMAKMFSGNALPVATRYAMRWVSTRVLPEPAPACTTVAEGGQITASRCWASSPRSSSFASTRTR